MEIQVATATIQTYIRVVRVLAVQARFLDLALDAQRNEWLAEGGILNQELGLGWERSRTRSRAGGS